MLVGKIYHVSAHIFHTKVAAKLRDDEWMGVGLSSGQTMDHGVVAFLLCKEENQVSKLWFKGWAGVTKASSAKLLNLVY